MNARSVATLPLLLAIAACGGARARDALGESPRRDAATALASGAPSAATAAAAPAGSAQALTALDGAPCAAPVSTPGDPASGDPALAATSPDGSTVALATRGGRLVAYVADSDASAVQTIDVDAGELVATTPLLGAPSQLVVMPDGRLVVAVPDLGRIEVLAPSGDALARICTRRVGAAPWGLARDPDVDRLVVTSAFQPSLTVLDAASMRVTGAAPIAKGPRSVIVRGASAYVSHLSGNVLTRVDVAGAPAASTIAITSTKASNRGTPESLAARRSSSQGYALASVVIAPGDGLSGRRILAPSTSVDPGDAGRPSETYYGDPPGSVGKQAPHVAVIDDAAHALLAPYVVDASATAFEGECLLPRAAAVDPGAPSLFVACMGIDEILELDARALDPMVALRRRFSVPNGPTGLALDADGKRLVVWSQLAGALSTVSLGGAAPVRRIEVPRPMLDPDWVLGRRLFFATDDVRITNDGLTCASCHPDGLEDGLTWRTPEGPRQTPMLAGRLAGTEPYGWSRDQRTLRGYISDTTARLGGKGLGPTELTALVTYVTALRAPEGVLDLPPSDVAAGRALFESKKVDCAGCHPGGGTDGAGHLLDLGGHDTLDTPSLMRVGQTAPYFHDGRYATLDALLADPKSHMGRAHGLRADDRRKLRTYLESL